MQKDSRELKKSAFQSLREQGHTYDDIKRILGVSERTLYNWAAEFDDEQFHGEQQQTVEVSEREQVLQNQINELKEHLDRLSEYYTRLWNQVHIRQKYVENEAITPYQMFFECMMESSDRRQAILNQQLQKLNEYEVERELTAERPSKPDTYSDFDFEERRGALVRWNKDIDIRSGRNVATGGNISSEVPQRNADEVRLLSETVEGRGFEQRIADRCFERSTRRILDGL